MSNLLNQLKSISKREKQKGVMKENGDDNDPVTIVKTQLY